MNRNKFFKILGGEIKGLPIEEQHNALEFYKEYFNESISEEDAISKLPHPKEIAANLYEELGVERKSYKQYSWPTIIGLSIGFLFFSPFILSALVIYVSLFFIVPASLVFALGVTFAVCMLILIPAFLFNPATGMTMFGLGLLCLGGSMLFLQLLLGSVKICTSSFNKLITKVRGY